MADCSALTANLAAQCEAMLPRLSQLQVPVTKVDAPPQVELEPDQALPLLRQLLYQLRARSLSARRLAEEVEAMLGMSELAKEFTTIAQDTRQLKYDAAIAELEQFLTRHGWNEL
jgi:hypothetical protein